ncbi:MAG: glycosyltransferase family 2 protein [Chitinophagaceae bacterium]|nr:MAG: glycosyltransferase family 2 protein [Chitinophagaceae bacterium]
MTNTKRNIRLKPISFIIITYNRPDDTLALLRNIMSLDGAGTLLQEVVLVNNASTSDYSSVHAYCREQHPALIRYEDAPENLGVARGRNYALRFATAPILVMIDDDAEMGNSDCLYRLLEEFERQRSERPKAIVSFKVLYYDTRELQRNTLPHKQFDRYKDKSFFETYFYAGGAHAIRRSALDAVGDYPEDFFYGMEEYDLSYRLLDAGFSIVYSDAIIMLHKESPLGRKPKAEKVRMMWVNKSKVAWRYLPLRFFWTTALLWSGEYLVKSGGKIGEFFSGWRAIFRMMRQEKRRTVSKDTLRHLDALGARLWY